MRELSGKVALITGGGRGVGRACALALAREGADLAVLARSTKEVEAVADEVRAQGRRALAITCDVADSARVNEATAHVRAELGSPLILVAAAGIATSARFVDISDELWERHLKVNATGAFYAARGVLPDMVQAGWGRVIVIASVAAKAAARYIAAYVASKHAMLGMTRTIALEYAGTGITANAICPGYLETEMTEQGIAAVAVRTGRSPEEIRKAFRDTSPQHRFFEAEEVAALAVFLCSDAARGINGQGIMLDGGHVMS
jgi:NAD(P)-dependent dehydrogenase (short-subunit alcohol dehydrogenase family)